MWNSLSISDIVAAVDKAGEAVQDRLEGTVVGSGLNALVDAVDKNLLAGADEEDDYDAAVDEPSQGNTDRIASSSNSRQPSTSTGKAPAHASASPVKATPITSLRRGGKSPAGASPRPSPRTSARQQQLAQQEEQQRKLQGMQRKVEELEGAAAQLNEQLQKAQDETVAVRQKLHNAVRKGKGIEQERNQLSAEMTALKESMRLADEGTGKEDESQAISLVKQQLAAVEEQTRLRSEELQSALATEKKEREAREQELASLRIRAEELDKQLKVAQAQTPQSPERLLDQQQADGEHDAVVQLRVKLLETEQLLKEKQSEHRQELNELAEAKRAAQRSAAELEASYKLKTEDLQRQVEVTASDAAKKLQLQEESYQTQLAAAKKEAAQLQAQLSQESRELEEQAATLLQAKQDIEQAEAKLSKQRKEREQKLKQELDAARSTAASAQAERDEATATLQQQLEASSTEVASLQQQLADHEQKQATATIDAQRERDHLQARCTELETRLQEQGKHQAGPDLQALTAELKEGQAAVVVLEEQLREAQQKLQAAEAKQQAEGSGRGRGKKRGKKDAEASRALLTELSQVKKRLEEAEAQQAATVAAKEKEIASISSQKDQIQSDLDALRNKLGQETDTAVQELDRSKTRVEQLTEQLAELQGEKAHLTDELAVARKQLDDLATSEGELKQNVSSQVSTLESQLTELQSQLTMALHEKVTYEKQLEQTSIDLQQQEETNQAAQAKLDMFAKLEARNQHLESQVAQLTKALQQEQDKFQGARDQKDEDITRLQHKVDELKGEKAKVEDALKSAQEKFDANASKTSEELEGLKAEMRELRHQSTSEAEKRLHLSLEAEERQSEAVERAVERTRGQLTSKMETEQKKFQSDFAALQKVLQGKEATIDELRGKVEALEVKLLRDGNALSKAEKDIESLSQVQLENVKELQQREQQLAALEAEVKDKQAELDTARQDSQKYQELMQRAEASQEEAMRRIKEATDAQAAAQKLEAQAHQAQLDAQAQIQSAKEECEAVKRHSDERKQRFIHVQASFSKKEQAFEAQVAAAMAEVATAQQVASRAEAELANVEKRRNEQIYDLECQLSAAQASSKAAQEATQQALEELKHLQEESLAQRLAARGEESISVELNSLKARAADMHASKAEMEEELRAAKSENVVLAKDKTSLQQRVDKLTTEVNEWHELAEQRLEENGELAKQLQQQGMKLDEQRLKEESAAAKAATRDSATSATQTDHAEEQASKVAQEEVTRYRQQVEQLSKTNQQLSWQVAMLQGVKSNAPENAQGQQGNGAASAVVPIDTADTTTVKGLRSRLRSRLHKVGRWRIALGCYLFLLHWWVFFATHHSSTTRSSYVTVATP